LGGAFFFIEFLELFQDYLYLDIKGASCNL